MDEVIVLTGCTVCAEPVIHRTPALLRESLVFCDDVCLAIGRALSAGDWHDASEIMQGGRFHDRPDIWTD